MISINRKAVRAAGGTQSDELAAKIKSVTSSTTIGSTFIYDTRSDSDGGAWRKKCQGLSWYDEDLNTSTRGGRREFPSVALIVADSESAEETLTIYDLDDPSMPMWMQFLDAGALTWASGSPRTLNAITALNGRVYLGWQDGLLEFNFAEDDMRIGFSSAYQLTSGRDIASRNVTSAAATGGDGYVLVQSFVNDVAATYLEGGELDSLGLVRPVVACATNGGVSVIHPNGSVYDLASTSHTNNDVRKVFFTDDGMVGYNFEASGSHDRAWAIGMRKIPFADENIQSWDNAVNLERYMVKVGGAVTGLTTNTDEYSSSDSAVNAVIPTGKNGLAIGYGDRLSIVKRNTGHMEEGAVAFVTSGYNSGYQLGDIRFAGLTNDGGSPDQSVKGNTLTANGTITKSAVATDAEMQAFSGFSASNYLTRAADTDFDFGTGNFSICFWTKFTSNDSSQCVIDRSTSGTPRILVYNTSGNVLQFYIHDTGGFSSVNAGNFGDNNWHQVVCVKRGTSSIRIFVDGVLKGETTSIVSGTLSSATAPLYIGVNNAQNDPLNGSLSLVRISATAPTPTQVKEMYEAEKPLFRSGAKCLLQSDGGSPNLINDLSYDNSTELLNVYQQGTNVAESRFRGLEMVETYGGKSNGWDSSTTALGSTAAGVKASVRTGGTGGVIVDLPAIDVRGDINTADSKLPDDGKLHFTGVTTDATPTVIGNIPVAEGENYLLNIRIRCNKYQKEQSFRSTYEIKQSVRRDIGENIVADTVAYKLTEESIAGMDAVVEVNTTSQTANLKVTGSSAARIVWNATVEVQRISEKTYER